MNQCFGIFGIPFRRRFCFDRNTMKVCPLCKFENEETSPTCVRCNSPLALVRSTPAADPDHPEHAQRALLEERYRDSRNYARTVGIFYGAFVVVTAALPGYNFNPVALALYLASTAVVYYAVLNDKLGQVTTPLVQLALSGFIVYFFGPAHMLTRYMLLGHAVAAAIFWHCVDGHDSMNR
jgi:hypothetical protein